MKVKNMKYSIGIDVGTSSVGWAVMDSNYNLLKWKGKNMWGSRLFDAANTAAGRRLSRSARRRYNKRRERTKLLRTLMNDMIMDIDSTFFIRMEHTSFLDKEDKIKYLNHEYKDNYNLFIDRDFNDKDFYKKYPTIYHLRKELSESKEKADPRLIYLALHHIVKYRGNFLYEGQSFNLGNANIVENVEEFFEQFFIKKDMFCIVTEKQISDMIAVFKQKTIKKIKIDKLMNIIDSDKEYKTIFTQLFTALVGNSFDTLKIFGSELINTDKKNIKLKFSDANFDEQYDNVHNELSEVLEIIDNMKSIYSWIELQSIIGDTDGEEFSISNAMVKRYQKHCNDLKTLKEIIKHDCPENYFEMFRNTKSKKANYFNYINHPKNTSNEDLCKYVKEILGKLSPNEKISKILNDIDIEDFLLKQTDRINGAVPYQMQLKEMEQILTKQGEYYPCLKKEFEKIVSILTFRIPYYYGPMNSKSSFSWLIKQDGKERNRIYPWNHSEIVDIDQTSERFITRMTNFCTYFLDEPVLPGNSLLMNKYEVLSELNKIRVNEKLLGVDIKNRIVDELFMRRKSVSEKALKQWFMDNSVYLNNEDLDIKGYQKPNAFASSLSSWIDFTNVFGVIDDSNFQVIESIIYDLTIFEDKKILKRRLEKLYTGLNDNQINKILKLKYSGWSRLSKKLINGVTGCYRSNEQVTIIEVMEKSNLGLMEIISDKDMGYKEAIEKEQTKIVEGPFIHDEVNKLAGSPAIKKGIWQSLLIVDEIKKIMKCEPENVYIEFAREEGEKKRTTSSIKRLQDIYKDLEIQSKHELEISKSINKLDNTSKISTDRLYLYYIQMGKCMYTGEELDIDKLSLYEVDHIVPQSLIKDDSLDNRVLVIKKLNQSKADSPIIPSDIRNTMFVFWEKLFDLKLLSPKKYFSLIKTEYNEKDQIRFINRQLVETRQIIKHVANIIKNHYINSNVVTVRAGLSHDFRVKYEIWKNRNVNDYHHAHDAYIACLLGTYIHRRFPNLDAKYIYGEYQKYTKKAKVGNDNDGFILNSMNNDYIDDTTGEVIWENSMLSKIKKCFEYKDCYITKKIEEFDGSLFKLTVRPNDKHSEKDKTIASIPVNKDRADVSKYGGFEGISYFPVAIKGKSKKMEVRRIVKYPILFKNHSTIEKQQYIAKQEALTDVELLDVKLYKNQLVSINGGVYYMTSPNELVNATQLVLSAKENQLVYSINQLLANKKYRDIELEDIDALYITLVNKMKKHYPLYQGYAKRFFDMIAEFQLLELKDKCIVIAQLLIVLQAGPQNGSIMLDRFKLSNRIGRLSSKTIDLNEAVFISQSVTGLFSEKYKL